MSLYISNVPRGGDYNEETGIDIDEQVVGPPNSAPGNQNYYDYDLLSHPRNGSGVIIPKVNNNFPSIGDYTSTEIINPDGTKETVQQLTQFISDDQSASLDTMTDSINNGRLGSINVIQDESIPMNTDIIINKDNAVTSVMGTLESTSLNEIFFSDMNSKVIQDTIRYKVHQNTDQVISEQSSNDLYIIMRSIMLQFANFRVGIDDIVGEIKGLNERVVEYAVGNISSNVKQHKGYIDDLSKLPVPMDMPASMDQKNYTYDISNLL